MLESKALGETYRSLRGCCPRLRTRVSLPSTGSAARSQEDPSECYNVRSLHIGDNARPLIADRSRHYGRGNQRRERDDLPSRSVTGPFGGNHGLADGPRYRALGNSMAVPVMRWVAERIQAVTNES